MGWGSGVVARWMRLVITKMPMIANTIPAKTKMIPLRRLNALLLRYCPKAKLQALADQVQRIGSSVNSITWPALQSGYETAYEKSFNRLNVIGQPCRFMPRAWAMRGRVDACNLEERESNDVVIERC